MRPERSAAIVPAAVAVLIALAIAACSKSPTAPSTSVGPPTHPLPTLADMLSEKTLGSPTAAVTMIEYSSLSCSHCADFDVVTFPLIKSTYIDTGRVKFVYRDFPLNDPALAASMVARCSGDRFFTTIDTLFRAQASWAYSASYTSAIKGVVAGLDITSDDVDACLAVTDLRVGILAAETGAQQYGINAVPTFLINNRTVLGALSFAEFAAIIDSM
jgi:protein-disulfide isomerase